MGCGCGGARKRRPVIKKKSSVKPNRSPVNSSGTNSASSKRRNSRMVKIKAINRTLTRKK